LYVGALVIIYAIVVHVITGVVLIVDPDAAASTGPSSVVQLLFDSSLVAGLAMLIAAALAIAAHLHRPLRSWAFWPQQLLLVVAAIGALVAVVMGNYADGTVRPTLFIATDQLPVMLRRFGFGATPPVDIPGASSGLVQDPLYRKENYPPGSIDADWQPGYDIQMSIGQGIDVTPLQLATAYSALANGGILPTPHFAKELRDSEGRVVKKLSFPPQRNLHLPESFLAEVRQGLYNASHSADGTSSSVFGNFKPDVAGKTGTAEVLGKADNAWYASWAPADNPEIVVVALIVGGGHGGVSAAPVAREVYSAYFHPNQKIRAQAGTDRSR